MTRGIYKQVLKEYRRTLSKAQRRNSYKTKIIWKYPFAGEKRMASLVKRIFRYYSDKVLRKILAREKAYPIHAVKRDSFESEMNEYLSDIASDVEDSVGSSEFISGIDFTAFVEKILTYFSTFNQEELRAYFEKRFGRPLFYTDPWWADLKDTWKLEFQNRVYGAIDAYMYKVRDIVFDYVKKEETFESLLSRIREVSESFTENQANFLARDLSGKLNGLIVKNIHTTLGINNYYWQSAADERVRGRPGGKYPNAVPSHWDIDGKVCNWMDVSKVSYDYGKTWTMRTDRMPFVHPGMDWQCRCIALPFDMDLLLQIDKELASEGA